MYWLFSKLVILTIDKELSPTLAFNIEKIQGNWFNFTPLDLRGNRSWLIWLNSLDIRSKFRDNP